MMRTMMLIHKLVEGILSIAVYWQCWITPKMSRAAWVEVRGLLVLLLRESTKKFSYRWQTARRV